MRILLKVSILRRKLGSKLFFLLLPFEKTDVQQQTNLSKQPLIFLESIRDMPNRVANFATREFPSGKWAFSVKFPDFDKNWPKMGKNYQFGILARQSDMHLL